MKQAVIIVGGLAGIVSLALILQNHFYFKDNAPCLTHTTADQGNFALRQTQFDAAQNESENETNYQRHDDEYGLQKTVQNLRDVNASDKFSYVSYYYRKERTHAWAGTENEKNLWVFLCSYKVFLSNFPLLMLIGTDVPQEEVKLIESFGAKIQLIRILPHLDPRPLKKNVAYEHMTKLIIWSLVQYEKIIFLDLDAWPIADLSWVFQLPVPRGQAAVKNAWRQYPVNTGVMLIAPNLTTYGLLMSKYLQGNYGQELHGVAGDQALTRGVMDFDYLPDGLNVKWPERRPTMKPENVYVLHNLLERPKNFKMYAKRHSWDKLHQYMELIQLIEKDKCVDLDIFHVNTKPEDIAFGSALT